MSSRRRFLAASLGGAAAALIAAPLRAAQFEFKHATDLAPAFPANIRSKEMWDTVRRETNGRLDVTLYPNSQLGSQTGILQQLRVGAVQFYTGDSGVFGDLVPSAAIDTIAFAFKSSAEATSVMDGPLGAYIRKEFDAKGLYAFEKPFDLGFRRIESVPHSIAAVTDLSGFKIRSTPGRIYIDLFRTLGASPTPLSGEEMYSGLQTHLIDGLDVGLSSFVQRKMFEVAKFVSLTNHIWIGNWTLANGDAWKSLPPDIRDIVNRNALRYTLLARQDAVNADAALIDQLKTQGVAFNTPDTAPFKAKLAPYYARWKPEIGAQAWSLLEAKVGPLR